MSDSATLLAPPRPAPSLADAAVLTGFRSRLHPEVAGRGAALRALWAPLASWVLVPMVVGVLAVLSRAPLTAFWIVFAATLALLSALVWLRVDRTVVEAGVQGGFVRLRSMGDVLAGRAGDFVPLLDVRYDAPTLVVTAGDQIRDLHAPDWPDAVRVALGEARRALHGTPVEPEMGA